MTKSNKNKDVAKEVTTKTMEKPQSTDEKVAVTGHAKKTYSYPSRSRCPRCQVLDTIATHTDNKIGRQYRQCTRPICRWKYSVAGKLI